MNEIISTSVPLPSENIDTDQIIPARFLKRSSRDGFGKFLFQDLRYTADGARRDFILNNEKYAGRILLVGKNFGCGSSREHAAWALKDYGFDVVISASFSDIFCSNAFNNRLLAITLTEEFVTYLLERVAAFPAMEISVNVESQEVKAVNSDRSEIFAIDPFRKHCLLKNIDQVDYLIEMRTKIEMFEKGRREAYAFE